MSQQPRLEKLGLHDTCGVHNLHGTPGVFSGLLSVLFSYLSTPEKYGDDYALIFEAMATVRIKVWNEGSILRAEGSSEAKTTIALNHKVTGISAHDRIFFPDIYVFVRNYVKVLIS